MKSAFEPDYFSFHINVYFLSLPCDDIICVSMDQNNNRIDSFLNKNIHTCKEWTWRSTRLKLLVTFAHTYLNRYLDDSSALNGIQKKNF